MTYIAEETSAFRGAPVELFHFRTDDALENWARTTGEVDIVDGLLTYVVSPIKRSGLRSSAGESQGPITVEVPLDDPLVAKFIAYLPSRQVLLTVFRTHLGDLLAEKRPVFIGTVNSLIYDAEKATLSCQPATNSTSRNVPWQSYNSLCNWALYGQGCGVLKSLFQQSLTTGPSFVSGVTLKDSLFATFPDGWFTNGFVEVPLTREVRFIVSHVGDTLGIIAPLPSSSVGETMLAYPGCDRTEGVCRSKYDNIVNYLGFSRVPKDNPFSTSFSGNASTGSAPPSGPGFIGFFAAG